MTHAMTHDGFDRVAATEETKSALDGEFAAFSARVRRVWKRSASFTLSAALTSFALFLGSVVLVALTRYIVVPRGPASLTRDLVFDYTAATPSAKASFVVEKFANLRLEPDVRRRVVNPKQTFDVEIEFVMPESEHNAHVGMFQVNAKLLTPGGVELLGHSRPAIVKYTSKEVKWLKTIVWWPLHAIGVIEERQTVRVTMVERYKEDAASPFTDIEVTMRPHAGSSKLPQIYEARAIIHLSMSQFARVLYFYPIFSSVVLVVALWCSSSMMAFVCLMFFLVVSSSKMDEDDIRPSPVRTKEAAKFDRAIADAMDSLDSSMSGQAPAQVTNGNRLLDDGLRRRANVGLERSE